MHDWLLRRPFWLRYGVAIVVAGVGAGVVGVLLSLLLHLIQDLAFGQTHTEFLAGVAQASRARRLLVPMIGAVICGLIWLFVRRRRLVSVADCMTDPEARLPLRRTTLDAIAQIIIVGTGSSIGREQAPRQTAAAIADRLSQILALGLSRRRILVAAAAGAGLAAVYNVPLAGAVFALEVVGLGVRRLENIVVAAVVSLLATTITWLTLGTAPTYHWITGEVTTEVFAWSLLAAPLCALVGAGFSWLIGWAKDHRLAATWRLVVALVLGAGLVGVASWWWPQLLGNGKSMVHLGLLSSGGLMLWVLLLVLKPLATTVSLASGAAGGTLTPSLATGAALGAVVAILASQSGLAAAMASFALVAAVGVLAVTQRAPIFAALFGWELAQPPIELLGPLIITSLGAYFIAHITGQRPCRNAGLPG